MKKYRFLALVLLSVLSPGCVKEIPDQVGDDGFSGPAGDSVTFTTTVSLEGSPASKALTAAGVKTFAEGDKIAVIYKNQSNQTVKAVSNPLETDEISTDGTTAAITVSLDSPASGGALRYVYPAAMAKETISADASMDDAGTIDFTRLDEQKGTLATIASGCDLAVYDGHLTDAATLPSSVTLTNRLTICEFTVKAAGSDDITDSITGFYVSDGTYSYAITRTAAAGPVYVIMRPIDNSATISLASQTATQYFERTVTGKTLDAGKMYPVGVNMTQTHTVNLAKICSAYEAQDGETLTGKLALCRQISIADGAAVTLSDADINGDGAFSHGSSSIIEFPGIMCNGDATLTLVGTSNLRGCKSSGAPGIRIKSSKTLTLNGNGSLNAAGDGSGASGIGGGKYSNGGNIVIESGTITATGSGDGAGIGSGSCPEDNHKIGNITIKGGTVTAKGGYHGAGIGTGASKIVRGTTLQSSISNKCGDITITGGTVTATGGAYAAGIGLGYTESDFIHQRNASNECGAITITSGVTRVTAIKGSDSSLLEIYCIGKGVDLGGVAAAASTTPGVDGGDTCGTITIGGVDKGTDGVNPDSGDTYIYEP